MDKKIRSWILMYFLGAFARLWLATSEYQKIISDRIEISTPLNSWKRSKCIIILTSISIL